MRDGVKWYLVVSRWGIHHPGRRAGHPSSGRRGANEYWSMLDTLLRSRVSACIPISGLSNQNSELMKTPLLRAGFCMYFHLGSQHSELRTDEDTLTKCGFLHVFPSRDLALSTQPPAPSNFLWSMFPGQKSPLILEKDRDQFRE